MVLFLNQTSDIVSAQTFGKLIWLQKLSPILLLELMTIDKIGHAKYVTKFDLLRGYWQVPLTERAKEVSAFVTPHGLYQYKVTPFGMKNSPATFQRLINRVISDLDGCECNVDDIYSLKGKYECESCEKCILSCNC